MNNTYFLGNKYSYEKYLYYIKFNNNMDVKTRFVTSAEGNFFDGENETWAMGHPIMRKQTKVFRGFI